MVKAEAPTISPTELSAGRSIGELSTKSLVDRDYARNLIIRGAQSVLGIELESRLKPRLKKQKAGKEFTGSNAIAIVSTSFIVAVQALDLPEGKPQMEYVSAAFYKEHIAEDLRKMQAKQHSAEAAVLLGGEYVRRPVIEYTLTEGEMTRVRSGESKTERSRILRDIFRSRAANMVETGENGNDRTEQIRILSGLIEEIDMKLSDYAAAHEMPEDARKELDYVAELINRPHSNKRAKFESDRFNNKFPHIAPPKKSKKTASV